MTNHNRHPDIRYSFRRKTGPLPSQAYYNLIRQRLTDSTRNAFEEHMVYLNENDYLSERVMVRFVQSAIERFNHIENLRPGEIKDIVAYRYGYASWGNMQANKAIYRKAAPDVEQLVVVYRRNQLNMDTDNISRMHYLIGYLSASYAVRIVADTDWVILQSETAEALVLSRLATMHGKFPHGVTEDQFKQLVALRFGWRTWEDLVGSKATTSLYTPISETVPVVYEAPVPRSPAVDVMSKQSKTTWLTKFWKR